ncbi:glycosyltransferase [Arthrobacter bambusae]|uniref:glycosyltransferase n=1 Tax=Arthrobacter TaxID=1663 RepID=UPI001F513667|nr:MULTISPECIES: glycosyltransferase [Arthrobacter]MCI0139975.1 glycosyltransferase [Arthrobacter bambusae]
MQGVLVHEWIDVNGGSEKVLDAMAEAFPDTDIHCLWNDAPQRFPVRRVNETWLSRTPLRRHKALALPLMLFTWRRLRSQSELDWMLVSSHLFAHHAFFPRNVGSPRKFVYVHTPARYIWVPDLDARGHHPLARIISPVLKAIDRRRANDREVEFAANSHFVKERIAAAWGREAPVIYPPVDVMDIQSVPDWRTSLTHDERALVDRLPKDFVLGASRFIPYKKLDLVIKAADLAGVPAVIAGLGPCEEELRALAAKAQVQVEFVISPSTNLLYALYQMSCAFIFPPIEDFGIMPVEAMAAGAPVIANSQGGAAETVVHGVTGLLLSRLTPESIAEAIGQIHEIDREAVRSRARAFSRERFLEEIRAWVDGQAG